MANVQHESLITANVHIPGYVQGTDPGAVGAGKLWTDTSGGTGSWVTRMRNITNTGWEVVGISGYSGVSGASGYSGVQGVGLSGYSGHSGFSGWSGSNPGASGYSGESGFSGHAGVATYYEAFTNSSFSPPGILSVVHSLGTKYNVVQIYNNLDMLIIPTSVIAIDSGSCTIDLTSFAPISGTWSVVVISGV